MDEGNEDRSQTFPPRKRRGRNALETIQQIGSGTVRQRATRRSEFFFFFLFPLPELQINIEKLVRLDLTEVLQLFTLSPNFRY